MDSTIFDYLRWRGDISFDVLDLTDEDQLVFSCLVYIDFAPFMTKDGDSIGSLATRVLSSPDRKSRFRVADDEELLSRLRNSRRFADLVVCDPESHFDKDSSRQFFAFTVIAGNEIVVVYRGTDATITGWKEDFDMTFSPMVPAQKDALQYLESAAARHPDVPIVISGHSKGGNLALFAAAMAGDGIEKRIRKIYNNDGPGFMKENPAYSRLSRIRDKAVTLQPTSSVIGMLMEHPLPCRIVESSTVFILQHDIYTWKFDGPRLKEHDKPGKDSLFFDRVTDSWLEKLTIEERKKFITLVSGLLYASGAEKLRDYRKNFLSSFMESAKYYRSLDPEERKIIRSVLRTMGATTGKELVESEIFQLLDGK